MSLVSIKAANSSQRRAQINHQFHDQETEILSNDDLISFIHRISPLIISQIEIDNNNKTIHPSVQSSHQL